MTRYLLRMFQMFRLALAISLATITLAAQPSARAWVLSDAGPNSQVRARLFLVDLKTGAIGDVGPLGMSNLVPLALAVDPVQDDMIVALRKGSASQLWRIRLLPRVGALSRFLTSLTGTVRSIMVGLEGDVFVVLRGGAGDGIYRIPRNGGTATRVVALPSGSVIAPTESGTARTAVWAQDARSAIAPGMGEIDLAAPSLGAVTRLGTVSSGRLTGAGKVIEGLSRYFTFSDDTGGLFLTRIGSTLPPVRVRTTPALPRTATQRVRYLGGEAMGVGRAPTPFLWCVNGFASGTVRAIAGPFPGSPVDFDHDTFRIRGTLIGFGRPCPTGSGQPRFAPGPPPFRIGNRTFGLQVWRFPANSPFAIALGIDDQQLGPLRLPLQIVPGCSLFVAPIWLFAGATNSNGVATVPFPLPNNPALRGATFMGQAFGVQPRLMVTSASSVRLER